VQNVNIYQNNIWLGSISDVTEMEETSPATGAECWHFYGMGKQGRVYLAGFRAFSLTHDWPEQHIIRNHKEATERKARAAVIEIDEDVPF